MAPQVGVKYAIPRPLGGVLRSLETLAAASGTMFLLLLHAAAVSLSRWGGAHQFCLHSMDTILRLLEGLRRDEIVWLTGRLRAMPPPAAAAAMTQVSAVPAHAGIAGDSVDEVPVAALAERVGDFNISMDPWEQTGAAPQGWAPHWHQTVIPVQGYVQLRPHYTTLLSFGGGPPATAGTANETIPTEAAITWMNGAGCICLRWLSCKICILHVIYKFCTYMVQPGCNPCNQHVLI